MGEWFLIPQVVIRAFSPSLCTGLPGVYVHVPSVVDWIKSSVEGVEQVPSHCSVRISNATHIHKYSLRSRGVNDTIVRVRATALSVHFLCTFQNVFFRNVGDGKVNIFKFNPLRLMTVDSRTRDAQSTERRVHWLPLKFIEDPDRAQFQVAFE